MQNHFLKENVLVMQNRFIHKNVENLMCVELLTTMVGNAVMGL